MKKVLLVSAIFFGAVSFASAQAVDVDPSAAKATRPNTAQNKAAAQKANEVAKTNQLNGARPALSTAAKAPKTNAAVATKPRTIVKKSKPATATKAN